VPVRKIEADGIRIGVMEQFYKVPVQPAIRAAVRKAGGTLSRLGFHVEQFEPAGIERAPNLWWLFFGILPAPFTRELIAGREDEVHFTGIEFYRQAIQEPQPTAKELVQSLALRDRLRGGLLRQMREVPVLLLPVCGTTAFRHRQRRYATPEKEISLFEAMMPSTPFNLFGMPGLAVPFGQDENGLPIGVQLVGRPWEEELLLEIGVRLEEARGAFPSPPGVRE
jgi:Asp-tRNA(Asn)/Glu-tRNA(Gln) amidotransferase A subunit family amidase